MCIMGNMHFIYFWLLTLKSSKHRCFKENFTLKIELFHKRYFQCISFSFCFVYFVWRFLLVWLFFFENRKWILAKRRLTRRANMLNLVHHCEFWVRSKIDTISSNYIVWVKIETQYCWKSSFLHGPFLSTDPVSIPLTRVPPHCSLLSFHLTYLWVQLTRGSLVNYEQQLKVNIVYS